MNRTIKFQLSNVKESMTLSTILAVGVIVIFYLFRSLIGANVFDNIAGMPLWVNAVHFLAAPFASMFFVYPIAEGIMYYDSSLRFGVSRNSYFKTQVAIYLILAIFVSFGNGISGVEWMGSALSYFSTISREYLSLDYIAIRFIYMLLISVFCLLFYRFKAKALLPEMIVFVLFVYLQSIWLYSLRLEGTLFGKLKNIILEHQGLSLTLVVFGIVGIYYVFVAKFEAQE